jgi:hypothetical protein
LGVVATAFLALVLGLGIGIAAVPNHFTSTRSGRSAANSIGTSQWDSPSPVPVPGHAGSALSLRGSGAGDRGTAPKHKGDASISDRSRGDRDEAASEGSATRQSNHRPFLTHADVQLVNVSIPLGSDAGAHPPGSSTTSAPAGTPGHEGTTATHHQSPAGKGVANRNRVPPNGTRETAGPQPTPTPALTEAPVPALGTALISLAVSRWAGGPEATSSNGRWTNRHHEGRDVTGSGNADPPAGEPHPDGSAATHAPVLHGHNSGRDAGPMQASRAGPDHD